MENNNDILLNLLKKSVIPATGCTEPIAVAYATARAAEKLTNKDLVSIEVQVDSNIYKNGLMVTIPGTQERGLLAATAFGFLFGQTEKGLRVIEGLQKKDVQKARDLLAKNKISVALNPDFQGLHIEVLLTTELEKVRVITQGSHLNIVSVEKTSSSGAFKPNLSINLNKNNAALNQGIRKYSLADFLEFSNKIDISELHFLNEGVQMNFAIAKEGMSIDSGVSQALVKLIKEGLISDNVVTYAQILCAAASEARMGGSSLPVMSTAGSGNQGITAFLTNCAVAEKQNLPYEKLLRSLALTNLITLFIKSYTGTLSAMCGCGVAAGIGASAGVVNLFDGTQDQIMGTLYNMVGSITGMVCDGAKEGCAYKLALASGWAVQSALLALKGAIIHNTDGAVSPKFEQLFQNLGYLCNPGMIETDRAILGIMLSKANK